MIVFLIELIIL